MDKEDAFFATTLYLITVGVLSPAFRYVFMEWYYLSSPVASTLAIVGALVMPVLVPYFFLKVGDNNE